MIKYRPHRGSLAVSMQFAQEFQTIEEMKTYILFENTFSGIRMFDRDDIVIGDIIGADERIGWNNVRYVMTKRYHNEDYIKKYGCPQVIGMCDLGEEE